MCTVGGDTGASCGLVGDELYFNWVNLRASFSVNSVDVADGDCFASD